MNKKSQKIETEELIFIILNFVFFAILLFFVVRSGSVDSILEEVYAKKIALVMDSMKPGMSIEVKADNLLSQIEKNKFTRFPVIFENNRVIVVTSEKTKGYSFEYFSEGNPEASIDNQLKTISVKLK